MAVSSAELKVVLSAVDSMTPELKKAQASLDDLDKSAASSGKTLSGLGEGIAKLTAGAAVVGVGALAVGLGAAVKSASDFEHSISGIVAVSGEGADSIDSLRQLALKLGADTSFSANEAAQGMEELVKAGVSMADIMGGAARASLDLAAAGEVSVSEAATIASNAMNAFSISGSDMGHVADVIAGAANASAIDVHEFGFSLSSAGAVAATVGFSFDDLATAIAVMGQAGIKGSDAGTSLKTMMLNLQPQTNKQKDLFRELGLETFSLQKGLDYLAKEGIMPASDSIQDVLSAMAKSIDLAPDMSKWTKDEAEAFDKLQRKTGMLGSAFFDTNGKVKSMAEVAGVLQNAMKDMTEQQRLATLETIFGSDAIRAGAVLAKAGAEGFNEMAASMAKVSAQDVANERLNNLQGSLEKLKGSLETAAIVIGSAFLPVLRQIVDAATDAINQGMPQMQEMAQGIADGFTAAVPSMQAFFAILMDNKDTIILVAEGLAAFAIIVTVTGWITGAIAAFSALGATIAASSGIIAGIVAILGGPITVAVFLIIAAITLLAAAWIGNWGDIQGKTQAVVSWFQSAGANVVAALNAINTTLVTWLNTASVAITTWLNTVGAAWTAGWAVIVGIVTTAWAGIQMAVSLALAAVQLAITIALGLWWLAFVQPLLDIYNLIVLTFTTISTWLNETFWIPLVAMFTLQLAALTLLMSTTWTAISTTTTEIWTAISTWFADTFWNPLVAFITTTTAMILQVMTTAWTAIQQMTTTIWTAIGAWFVSTFWTPLVALTTTATAQVQQVISSAWTAIQTITTTVWNGMLTLLTNVFGGINRSAASSINPIPGIFASAWSAVKSGIEGTLAAAGKTAAGVFSAITSAADKARKAIESFIKSVGKAAEKVPGIFKPGSPPPLAIGFDFITDAIGRATAAAGDFGGQMSGLPSGPMPTGGVTDWISAAVARTGVPASWIPALSQLAMLESSGDPFAQNTTPAAPGQYATGLMQTIPSTFAAYGGGNIYDPVDNASAAIRYIQARYGDPFRVLQVWAAQGGYKYGGVVEGALGQAQMAMVHGGEMVLTPGQQAALLHGSAGGGGQIVINVNAPVYGVNDMENVVISALDRAQRRART